MAIDWSVVIPVCNEASVIKPALERLRHGLTSLKIQFEIILAENGSRDETRLVAAKVARQWAEVSWVCLPEANYGAALKQGIAAAKGRFVACDEIDLCDVGFHRVAWERLRTGDVDMVLGSKTMRGAEDRRPLGRRVATHVYHRLLRILVGLEGSDTHGLKAFRADVTAPIIATCVVEHDVFTSELVVRSERAGLRIEEIPVQIAERRPTPVKLWQRIPKATRHLAVLSRALDGPSTKPRPR